MQELMLLMAKAMPIEMIIDQMEKAIHEYKADPTDVKRSKIGAICIIFNSKEVIEAGGGDVLNTIKDFREKEKIMDMMDMKNNVS